MNSQAKRAGRRSRQQTGRRPCGHRQNGRAGGAALLLLFACTGEVGAPPGSGGPTLPRPVDPGFPVGPGPIDPVNPNPVEPIDPVTPVDPPPAHGASATLAGSTRGCDVDLLSGPHVYGSKVKTLLTGEALTEGELGALQTAPEQLPDLIDQWMTTPAAESVLTTFFATAFQQNQIDVDGLPQMLRRNNLTWGRFTGPNQNLSELMIRNLQESFARTAMGLVREGRPFSETVTTETFEMTTAMLVLHALIEQRHADDQNRLQKTTMPEVSGFTFVRHVADAPPVSESLDPSSPNFLTFYIPGFDNLCLPAEQDRVQAPLSWIGGGDEVFFLFSLMVGRPTAVFNRAANQGRPGNPCVAANNMNSPPLLTRADFEDWRPVRLRPVQWTGEEPSRFYRLDQLRGATELAVRTDRMGFATTLGFLSTWPTNEDNAARVTVNQALIVALGASFDGETVTDFSPTTLDEEHSAPGTACYSCHQTLDPMRDFFRQSYSFNYGRQSDAVRSTLEPHFVFRGVRRTGEGVRDFARTLAEHPDFPRGWAQKFCVYANGAPCPEESPEFAAVLEAFTSSGLDFRVLLRTLFSSPLVTHDACVEGGTGHLRSISRRDQLCAQLSTRLGVDDICGASLHPARRNPMQRDVAAAVVSIPEDTFARGEPDPLVISQTGLFTRASREVACTVVAERAYATAFGNQGEDAVLPLLVERVMGLVPGDPRRDPAFDILRDHVREAREDGASERVALQSALVVACMAPGMAGIGF